MNNDCSFLLVQEGTSQKAPCTEGIQQQTNKSLDLNAERTSMELVLKNTIIEKSTKAYVYIKLSHTSKILLYRGVLTGLRTNSRANHLYKLFRSSIHVT